MAGKHGPLHERLMRHVQRSDGCWTWTGSRSPKGYGRVNDGRGRVVFAHRASYESFVGPIPEGLTIDHLCRNKSCINPKHLEPVTAVVNWERGGWQGRCRKGHDQANFVRKHDGTTAYCRECRKQRRRHEAAEARAQLPSRPCRACGSPIPASKRRDSQVCSVKCGWDYGHLRGRVPSAGH